MSEFSAKLREFIDRVPAIVMARRTAAGLPAIGRVMGVRLSPDGTMLDMFVARAQWPLAVDGLSPGDVIAVTLGWPINFETYQIKGPLEAATPADAADHAYAEAYIRDVGPIFRQVGAREDQVASWLLTKDLVRLRIRLDSAFNQTPGPRAGRKVEAAQ